MISYAPVPLMVSIGIGAGMVLLFSCLKLKSSIPIVGKCSAVISVAFNRPQNEPEDVWYSPLQWG